MRRRLVIACLTVSCGALLPVRTVVGRRARSVVFAADEEFDVDMMLLETEEKMDKSITALQSNLGALRTGRASPWSQPSASDNDRHRCLQPRRGRREATAPARLRERRKHRRPSGRWPGGRAAADDGRDR